MRGLIYAIQFTTRDQQPRAKEEAHMSDTNERSVASAGSVAWIPVTERLPDDGTWCWVDWDGPGNPFPAMRDTGAAGGWTNHDTWEDFKKEVTRWSPLTAPPNGSR